MIPTTFPKVKVGKEFFLQISENHLDNFPPHIRMTSRVWFPMGQTTITRYRMVKD
jgi:hypothetical protein